MKTYGLLTIIIFTGLIFINPNVGFAESNEPNITITKTVEERLAELEQKQKIVERQLEIEREAAAERAQKTPIIGAGPKGFFLESPDGNFKLKFGGYIQADSRSVTGKKGSTSDDTFLLRRVRPTITGTIFKDIDFKIMPDFGGGTTTLQDAYLNFKYFPKAKFQVGKFKVPFGIERLQSSRNLLFVERGLPDNLVPNRDIGAMLHGDLFDGKISYAAGIFNGVADRGSGDSDIDGNKEYAARIFAEPWKGSNNSFLEGLGVGFAATFGDKEGTTSSSYLPTYKTAGQQTFFQYRSDVLAAGRHTRYSPQVYYHYGSFGLLAEYVLSEQQVSRGSAAESLKNKAWQIAASYVLTGESASYKGVKPKKSFSPEKGEWGAFELVGRVGQLNVDDNAFPTFADSTKYASAAKAWGLGLNWYLNNNVKASLDYDQTSFTGGASSGNRQNERAILARVQVSF